MANDKKINVGVDDSGVNKLRQSTNELAKDMIRSSRQYSTSAKEVLKDLEDQIRAIEKRNKLEAESARMNLQMKRDAGSITPDQYSTQIRGAAGMYREDKMQTQLLRELIDTIKSTAKEEIRENRSTVEQTIRRDRRTTQLNPEGSPEENLRRTIQRDILGEVGEAETDERSRFRRYGKSAGAGVNQALSTVANSPNAFYMAAAVLGLTPIVGQGLSAMANKIVGSADRYEKSAGKLSALSGGTIEGETGRIESLGGAGFFSKFGLSNAAVAEKMYGYKKASGLKIGDLTAMQLMAMERSLDIDPSMMQGLAGIQRYDSARKYIGGGERIRKIFGQVETTPSAASVYGDLPPLSDSATEPEKIARALLEQRRSVARKYGEGDAYMGVTNFDANGQPILNRTFKDEVGEEKFREKGGREVSGIRDAISILDRTSRGNHAVLQEMLGTFTNASNQILAISGRVNMQEVAAGVHGVSRSLGVEGKQLDRFVGGIQGLGKSQNPVVRSLMLQSLKKVNPNASFFELQAMMENPMGNMKAMQEMFNRTKTLTGGEGELNKQVMFSMFGGAISRNDLMEGKSFDHIYSEAKKAEKIKPPDHIEKLEGKIGSVETSTAYMESLTQVVGEKVVNFLDEQFSKLSETLDSLFNSEEYIKKTQQAVKNGVIEGNKNSGWRP
jgi:hypothetical protein